MESFNPHIHIAKILHACEKLNTAYVSTKSKSRWSQRHNMSKEADVRKKRQVVNFMIGPISSAYNSRRASHEQLILPRHQSHERLTAQHARVFSEIRRGS